jgi:hypothetical protein
MPGRRRRRTRTRTRQVVCINQANVRAHVSLLFKINNLSLLSRSRARALSLSPPSPPLFHSVPLPLSTGSKNPGTEEKEGSKESEEKEENAQGQKAKEDAPNEVSKGDHIKRFLKRTGKISDHVVWGLALGFNPQTKH